MTAVFSSSLVHSADFELPGLVSPHPLLRVLRGAGEVTEEGTVRILLGLKRRRGQRGPLINEQILWTNHSAREFIFILTLTPYNVPLMCVL